MTVREALKCLKDANTEWQHGNATNLFEITKTLDAVVTWVLANDDEMDKKSDPTDPYNWVRKLPDNTPVEVREGDEWGLRYTWNGTLCSSRNGDGVVTPFGQWDDIRWPLPPDKWAAAHEDGATHIIVYSDGASLLVRDPSRYPLNSTRVAVVPIPEATE